MANKTFEKGLNEASDLLNEIEGLPLEQRKTVFDIIDGILSNMSVFVTDPEAWKKIKEKEEKVHKEFSNKLAQTRSALKEKDPLYQWQEGLSYMMDLRMWKSKEMLAFWNDLAHGKEI